MNQFLPADRKILSHFQYIYDWDRHQIALAWLCHQKGRMMVTQNTIKRNPLLNGLKIEVNREGEESLVCKMQNVIFWGGAIILVSPLTIPMVERLGKETTNWFCIFTTQDPQQTCYCMWRVEIGLHLTFSAKFNQQLSWIESKQARKRGFESNQRKNQSFTEWLNFTQSIPTLFPKSSLSLLDRKTDMKSFADPQKCFTLLNK